MKKTFWGEVFCDNDGDFSFKRVQTALFSFLFALIVIINLFTGRTVSDNILQLLSFLVAYGYTGIAVEKFAKRGITPTNQ